jgi:hypothetical protein
MEDIAKNARPEIDIPPDFFGRKLEVWRILAGKKYGRDTLGKSGGKQERHRERQQEFHGGTPSEVDDGGASVKGTEALLELQGG